jgi:hypothetical protein
MKHTPSAANVVALALSASVVPLTNQNQSHHVVHRPLLNQLQYPFTSYLPSQASAQTSSIFFSTMFAPFLSPFQLYQMKFRRSYIYSYQ